MFQSSYVTMRRLDLEQLFNLAHTNFLENKNILSIICQAMMIIQPPAKSSLNSERKCLKYLLSDNY